MIMKQSKEKFDFKAFGQAIKAARKAKGISRNQLADKLNIAPRYIASIENSGLHPSLQILYELVTLLDVSVDQFFFPEREQEKSTRRRQLDTMLNGMSEKDLKILSATAKGIAYLPPLSVGHSCKRDRRYRTVKVNLYHSAVQDNRDKHRHDFHAKAHKACFHNEQ